MTDMIGMDYSTMRLSDVVFLREQDYERQIESLTEQLESANRKIEAMEADHKMDLVMRTKHLTEQLADAYGENFQLMNDYENFREQRDTASEENAQLSAEIGKLRLAVVELREDNEMLTECLEEESAKNMDLQDQMKVARWDLLQMQIEHGEDKTYVPERQVCQHCKSADTEYRNSEGYYCHRCESVYEPYPRRD
jgi:hypothetical protein